MAGSGVELATAYVSLAVSTKGLAKGVKGELGGIESEAEKSGKRSGGLMSKALGGALKAGAAGVAAVGIGALGTSMVKGFQRLNALDQATAKLTGLGHSAESVDKIMNSALGAVKGTAFGMGEAATTAAGAVAAGIKPGKDLQDVLTLVADAATIAGTDMGSMGSIFNKVATSGKVQGDVLNQLSDQGIPIVQLLSEQLGVSAEKTYEMASAGEIGFDTFRKAMEAGMGGAAQESGQTFSGAMDNVMAALGRVGANLLDGIFPAVKDGMLTLQDALGPVEDAAKTMGEAIGGFIQEWKEGEGAGGKFRDVLTRVADAIKGAYGFVVDNWETIKLLAGIVAGTAAAYGLWQVALVALRVPMMVATAAQWAMNAALSANPIGIIILAIGALVGAILYLWNNNEGFRDFIIGAWEKIKGAFLAVVDWVKDVLVPGFRKFFEDIAAFARKLVEANKLAWEKIIGAFRGAWEWVVNTFKKWWQGIVDIFGGPINKVRKIVEVFVGLTIYIIRSIWDWLKGTFQKLWAGSVAIFSGPIQKVLDFIGRFVEANKRLFRAVWDWVRGVFAKAWAGVKAIFSGPLDRARQAISNLIGRVRSTVLTIWYWARDTFQRNWNKFKGIMVAPINLARDAIGKALDRIKDAFGKTKDAIGKAWDKIKSVMAAPVKWVANNVVNPLIGAFNKVARAVGMEHNQLSEWKFAGFASGGWTGPGGKFDVAGIVHADEFVVNKAARGKFESRFPGYLNYINRTGNLPGYANGGQVYQPVPGRGRRHSGYGWTTWAGDFPVPMGTPIHAWKDGIVAALNRWNYSYGKHVRINHTDGTSSLYAHMSKILVRLGQMVGGGQVIGRVGSTGNSTGPHLHFETMGGPYNGGKGSTAGALKKLFAGFTSPLAWLKDLIAAPLGKLGSIPGGMWGDIIAGLPRMMKDGMIDKINPFDSGGYLQPGYTLAYNGTGKPEPVFTSDQFDSMRIGGGGLNIHGDVYAGTPEQFVAEIEKKQQRAAALRPVVVG